MEQKFNSPIFGETRHGSNDERAYITKAVEEIPVTVFQELGKKLNALGFMLTIISKDDVQ